MLTPRMKSVADLIAEGKQNKEIAHALGLSTGTIKVYIHRKVFPELKATNRTEVAIAVLRHRAEGTWD